MTVKSNLSGLKRLAKNAEEMHGKHQVKLIDLMPNEFIRKHSNFNSLEELFNASGYEVKTPEDFAAIPDQEWESFIVNNTKFESWEDMRRQAAVEYTKRQLFKGI